MPAGWTKLPKMVRPSQKNSFFCPLFSIGQPAQMMTQTAQENKMTAQENKMTAQAARDFLQKYEEDLLQEVKTFWRKYEEESLDYDDVIPDEAIQEILDTNKSDEFVNKLCSWVDKGWVGFEYGYGKQFFKRDEETYKFVRK